MAGKKVTNKPSASDALITLESLQAAARGIRSKAEVRQSKIRICSCNVQPSVPERGTQDETNFEYFVYA